MPSAWPITRHLSPVPGTAGRVIFSTQPQRETEVGTATLQVSSLPTAAAVAIDGQTRGRTPIDLLLPPGEHRVTVRHEQSMEATYQVRLEAGQTASIAAELWLRSPHVQRLRPPFPGGSIVGADFLQDGRVALAVALPPGDERQSWRVDGTGGMRRLALPAVCFALAAALALARPRGRGLEAWAFIVLHYAAAPKASVWRPQEPDPANWRPSAALGGALPAACLDGRLRQLQRGGAAMSRLASVQTPTSAWRRSRTTSCASPAASTGRCWKWAASTSGSRGRPKGRRPSPASPSF